MSFYYKNMGEVEIDDVITDLISYLVLGGWSEPDSGYDVVLDPNGEFYVNMDLEATNKRYLQFEIGHDYNTGTHVMTAPFISIGFVMADTSTGHPTGTEKGAVEMNCDDYHFCLWGDWTTNGANYRKNFIYLGYAKAKDSADSVLLGGAHLFRGTNATPTNDATVVSTLKVLKDVNGVSNKPTYSCYVLQQMAASAKSQEAPRGQIHSVVANRRYIPEIHIGSNTSISGGEASGLRATLYDLYHGFYDDAESHGNTGQGTDLKEFKYWKHATDFSYCNIPTQVMVRIK